MEPPLAPLVSPVNIHPRARTRAPIARPANTREARASGPARRPLREDALREAPPGDEAQVVQAEQDAHEVEESDGGGPALEHLDSRVPLDARAAGSVVGRIERVRDERGETA